MELFRQMQEQELAEHDSAPSSSVELPDPAELFRRMEEEQVGDPEGVSPALPALPDPMELFHQMQAEEDQSPDDDSQSLVDTPLEDSSLPLFGESVDDTKPAKVLDPDAGMGAWEAGFHLEASSTPLDESTDDDFSFLDSQFEDEASIRLAEQELDFGLPELPVGQQDLSRPADPAPSESDSSDEFDFPESEIASLSDYQISEAEFVEDDPFTSPDDELPDPAELFRRIQGNSDGLECPAPSDPSPLLESIDADASLSFFGRLKKKFKKSKEPDSVDSVPIEKPEVVEVPPLQPDTRLPTPDELFRQYQEEDDDSVSLEAISGEPPELDSVDPGPDLGSLSQEQESDSTLPTPAELFRRIQEESDPGSELPALPDLNAFKRQLEEEEKARLDPDIESELSGPQRFVETVSDSMFTGGVLSGFLTPFPEVLEPEPSFPELEDAQPPRLEMERPVEPSTQAPTTPPASRLTGTVRVGVNDGLGPEQQEEGLHDSWVAGQEPEEKTYRARHPYDPAPKKLPSRKKEESKADSRKTKTKGFGRFSRYKLAIFTRQMAVMLKAGIQLHASISFSAESDPTLQSMLSSVVQKIETGYTLSAAFAEASRTFDPIYLGLIQAGELSGRLPEMLTRLADALEREVEMRKKLIATITYPAMLFLVCILGTLGFVYFVLPTLTPLFDDLGVNLPLPTRILLMSKDLILPGVLGSLASVVLFYLGRDRVTDFFKKRPLLERRLSAIPFKLPVIGDVYTKVVTARVLYSLATMLDVGITLNQALARAETTSGNALTSYRLSKARMDLADGVGVTDCFRFNELFTPSALHLISAGEESAKLAEMFQYVAKLLDEEVEYALQSASSILEPLIMVVMGLVVGFITISAALPTIQLLQNFS
jgi:type IV pilus assembly protein PilC